jgi:hypothetical protein
VFLSARRLSALVKQPYTRACVFLRRGGLYASAVTASRQQPRLAHEEMPEMKNATEF